MNEQDIHNELSSIRSMMERSSKFISLSGLSGILAGVYALAGSAIVYEVIHLNRFSGNIVDNIGEAVRDLDSIIITGCLVLLAAVVTAIILSAQKAKRKGLPLWGKSSKVVLFNMIGPLLTGGILITYFLYQGLWGFIIPTSLIFYGMALLAASNFTFNELKYLGACEIAIGLTATFLPAYELWFWAFGFGVLHIIYGSVMYYKYDR